MLIFNSLKTTSSNSCKSHQGNNQIHYRLGPNHQNPSRPDLQNFTHRMIRVRPHLNFPTYPFEQWASDSMKGLQQCQKSADNIVNFWEDHLMNGKLFPEIPLGSVDQFWRQVLSHGGICFHQNNRANNVVKEFIIHSVFDEIDDLVRFGYAFKHKVQNFRSIRLTELKPTPLVVQHRREWCSDPKRFREWELPLEHEPTACM